ncbi:MAG: hypothetical protein ACR2IA_07415, partial [Pyrinomonadaceae bacterium]
MLVSDLYNEKDFRDFYLLYPIQPLKTTSTIKLDERAVKILVVTKSVPDPIGTGVRNPSAHG